MPLIECTAGPVETTVGGTNYSFQRDQFTRYVSQVYNDRHVECFLGSDLYRVVDAIPAEKVEPKKVPAKIVAPEPALTPPAPVFTPPPPPPVPAVVPAADGLSQGSTSGLTPPVPPIVALPPVVPPVPPIPPIVAAALLNPAHGLTPAIPPITVTTPLGEKTATPVVKAPKNRAARRRGK